jgi:hypothetical protein
MIQRTRAGKLLPRPVVICDNNIIGACQEEAASRLKPCAYVKESISPAMQLSGFPGFFVYFSFALLMASDRTAVRTIFGITHHLCYPC